MTSVTRPSALSETEHERRRRRRALVRAHHPDRGGDAAEFIRLLHTLDQHRPWESRPEVRFVRRRRWWHGAVSLIPPFRRTSRRPKRVV
jgi:hypothetical protein